MKTLLLTGYDEKMRPLGDLTSPLMLSYASEQGFDFHCLRTFDGENVPYWHKLNGVKWAFNNGFDRVFWLDADQVITNPDFNPPWKKGFHASLDWGTDAENDSHFSMCGFVVCKDTVHLIDWVLSMKEAYVNGDFPDQKPMQEFYKFHRLATKTLMQTHSRRKLNAVPKQIADNVVEPWERGDFCAHLTMLPVEDRVKVFHEIMKEMTTWP